MVQRHRHQDVQTTVTGMTSYTVSAQSALETQKKKKHSLGLGESKVLGRRAGN